MSLSITHHRSPESRHPWRLLLIGLVLTLVAAACTSDPNATSAAISSSTTETETATTSVQAEPTATPVKAEPEPTTAPAQTASDSTEPTNVANDGDADANEVSTPLWERGKNATVPAGTQQLPFMGGLQITFENPHFVRQAPPHWIVIGDSSTPASVEIWQAAARTDGTPIETAEDLRRALQDLDGGIELVDMGAEQYPIGAALHLGLTRQTTSLSLDNGISTIDEDTGYPTVWQPAAATELWIFETDRGVMVMSAESHNDDSLIAEMVTQARTLLPTLEFTDLTTEAEADALGETDESAVEAADPPPNDLFANAIVIDPMALPFVAVVDTTGATADDDDVNVGCPAPATDASVWYSITPTSDARLLVSADGSDYSYGISALTGDAGSFAGIECRPFSFIIEAQANITYHVHVFDGQTDWQGNGGNLTFSIEELPTTSDAPDADATTGKAADAEYLAAANEICRVGAAEIEAAFDAAFPVSADSTEEEAEQIAFDALIINVRGQFDDLRDLNGPTDLEDELHAILDEASEVLDQIANGGPEAFFATQVDQFSNVKTQLRAIGLNTCADS